MADLPAALKAVIAAEIAFSILAAAFGTPPQHQRRRGRELVVLVAALATAGAAVALHAAHHPLAMKLTLAACVELLCALTWLRRAPGPDDGGGGDDGNDAEPEVPPPGYDWDAFDRARNDWEPTRHRSGRSVRA
jgi:hypothetical protein